MINALSPIREVPSETTIESQAPAPQNKINFRAGNTLEQSPTKDTFGKKDKKKKTLKIIAGTLSAAALVTLIICYSKGGKGGTNKTFGERIKDGWKELFGKAESSAGSTSSEARASESASASEGTTTPKPELSEAAKPGAASTEEAEAIIEKPVKLLSKKEMRRIKNGRISQFTLTKGKDTFTVKNGEVVECLNENKESWIANFKAPQNAETQAYVDEVMRDIKKVMDKNDIEILKNVDNIKLTPSGKNPRPIELTVEQLVYYIQNFGK